MLLMSALRSVPVLPIEIRMSCQISRVTQGWSILGNNSQPSRKHHQETNTDRLISEFLNYLLAWGDEIHGDFLVVTIWVYQTRPSMHL
jgi:hypothetical protein